jgi:protein-S-isoprenylcysteine O-methyltransferase Ste14
MVKAGNFLFRYRNALFPLVYALLIFRSPPIFSDFRRAAVLGVAVALLGQALRAMTIGLEYIIRGGRNRMVYATSLVQGGMFAHCRNPLYVGNFLILVGVGLASNSVVFVSCAIPFFAFSYWAIIAAEENYLRDKFGQEFEEYCARVNRLVPDLSGIRATLSGMRFNWSRLITAEYGSTFVWIAAVILVTLKNLWSTGQYGTSGTLVLALWVLLGMAALAYAVARFLKKSRVLKPG